MNPVWHMRKRRSGFLSQATPGQGASTLNPVIDFFTAVDRTYTQVSLSMDTSQSGYNLDVARAELSSARDSNSKAFDLLKAAKDQGLISAEDASDLASSVMTPLGDAIGQAAEAIERGQSFILSYWDQFKNSVAGTVESVLNFVSVKWQDLIKSYRYISDYVANGDALVASLQGTPGVSSADIENYRVELEKIRVLKLQIEAAMQAAGIKAEDLKKAASEVPGLGAILDKVVLGVTVGTLVYRVWTVVRAILAAISAIGLFLAFAPGAASLVGLESLVIAADKARLEAEAKAQSQFQRDQADAQAKKLQEEKDRIKGQIKNTIDTVDGLSKVIPGQADAGDKLKQYVDAEKAKKGIPTGVSGAHVLLAALAGLGLAGVVHYFRKGKA